MTHVPGVPLVNILLFTMQIRVQCGNDSNVMNVLVICSPKCSLPVYIIFPQISVTS